MRRRKLISIDHAQKGEEVWYWGDDPMPRYVRQRDGYRCGPIAVANALKWAGVNFSWKENKYWLTKELQCCEYHGTEPQNLEDVLKKYGEGVFTVRYRSERLKLSTIREEISKGRAIVVDFSWPKRVRKREHEDGHYSLLIDIRYDPEDGTEYFGLVNFGYVGEQLPVEYVQASTFKRICLRRLNTDNFWILRKVN